MGTCQATVKSMARPSPELRNFREASSRKDVGVCKICVSVADLMFLASPFVETSGV